MAAKDEESFTYICSRDCVEPTSPAVPCLKCRTQSTIYFKSIKIEYFMTTVREISNIYCVVCKICIHSHDKQSNYSLKSLEKMRLDSIKSTCFNSPSYKNVVMNHESIIWTRFQDINIDSKQDVMMLSCSRCERILEVQTTSGFHPPNNLGNTDQTKIHYQTCYNIPSVL